MRSRNNLGRRRAQKDPYPRVLVVCEGEITEPHYFQDLRREWRSHLNLVACGAGVPLTVVETAIAKRDRASEEARRKRDHNLVFDEVWCVFDQDEHPNVCEAFELAQRSHLKVAFSNPCFELWLLLHFQDQRSHLERGRLQAQCRELIPGFEKRVPIERVIDLYELAKDRAIQLERWQCGRDCERANPWTDVYQLTERIRLLGETAKAKRR